MTPYDSRRLRELAALRLVWASAAWLTNPNFHKLGPGICTRDTRDNSGPGGKPAQYRSKTPPKGHTRFTHTVHAHTVHTHCSHTRTTKNKVERLPSLRCARALQYHCLTPMLTPVWYHSAHAPSTVQLALWAAPAPFVTPRRRPTTRWQQLPPSRRVALLRAYRNLTGAYPSSGSLACQAVAGWLASRRASSHPAVAHVPDLRQWRQPAVRAWIARRSWAPVSLVAAMTRSARPKTRFQIRLRVHRR